MVPLQALILMPMALLADTEADGHRPAFNLAFQEAGLDWEWDRALYGELLAVTGGKERIRHYLERWRPAGVGAAGAGGLYRRAASAQDRFITWSCCARGPFPAPRGAARSLEEARAAGLRLAVATTTTPENVITLLECAGGPGVAGLVRGHRRG